MKTEAFYRVKISSPSGQSDSFLKSWKVDPCGRRIFSTVASEEDAKPFPMSSFGAIAKELHRATSGIYAVEMVAVEVKK